VPGFFLPLSASPFLEYVPEHCSYVFDERPLYSFFEGSWWETNFSGVIPFFFPVLIDPLVVLTNRFRSPDKDISRFG